MALPDILEALNADPSVQRRLKFADTVIRVQTGEADWAIALRGGRVEAASSGDAADVTIRIDSDAWTAFQQPVPPPGCHDIYALAETGRAEVTGDFLTLFRYSYVLKDVLQQLATGRMYG